MKTPKKPNIEAKVELRNRSYGNRAYWHEQTARLAECFTDSLGPTYRNYASALKLYEKGGWLEDALRIAKKLKDGEKIKQLEARLK